MESPRDTRGALDDEARGSSAPGAFFEGFVPHPAKSAAQTNASIRGWEVRMGEV